MCGHGEGDRVRAGIDRGPSRRRRALDAQRAQIAAWADAHGGELAGMFVDAGVSGKRADNRAELQKSLALACRTRSVLVVYSLSRLARSTRDAIAIAERLGKARANLVSLTEAIDTTTAAGKDGRQRIALIPSRVTATGLGRELHDALRKIGEQVLPAIGQRVAVAASALDGKTVGEFAASSTSAEEFRALARAVEKAFR